MSPTFMICVLDFPRGEVSVKVGVMEFGLKQTGTRFIYPEKMEGWVDTSSGVPVQIQSPIHVLIGVGNYDDWTQCTCNYHYTMTLPAIIISCLHVPLGRRCRSGSKWRRYVEVVVDVTRRSCTSVSVARRQFGNGTAAAAGFSSDADFTNRCSKPESQRDAFSSHDKRSTPTTDPVGWWWWWS